MPTPLWEKLEDDTIVLTGGEPTKASGRLRDKGDVQTKTLLIECKHRSHKGPNYAAQISQDWCDTTQQHADDVEKIPILVCGLTWTKEKVIDFRLTLCLKRDVDNFLVRVDTRPFVSIPEDWITITEESVLTYCEEERRHEACDDPAQKHTSSTWKSQSRMSGRPMAPGRPMKSGPSRWGR